MNVTEYKTKLYEAVPEMRGELDKDIMFQFSKLVSEYRDTSGLSNADIAEMVELERSAIVRLTGGSQTANIATLQKFVDVGILTVSLNTK